MKKSSKPTPNLKSSSNKFRNLHISEILLSLTVIILVVTLIFASPIFKLRNPQPVNTSFVLSPANMSMNIPAIQPILVSRIKTRIKLNNKNFSILKGEINAESVAAIEFEIYNKISKLNSDKPFYLILDTPGGDISEGLKLVDFLKGLHRPIHTISFFSASMGFYLVQTLDNRYALPSSVLMSHRATLGMEGQFPDEFFSRLSVALQQISRLELTAATRMGRDQNSYKKLVEHELWLSGPSALNAKAIDELVYLSCDSSLNTQEVKRVRILIFDLKVTFSGCPLITAPIKVEMADDNASKAEKAMAFKAFKDFSAHKNLKQFINLSN